MPRYPSFYLTGALAGLALIFVRAPGPIDALGAIVCASGLIGLALSIVWLRVYDRWLWRVKIAALRRFARSVRALLVRLAPARAG